MENPGKDIIEKIKAMQADNSEWIIKECERLMNSGGIDIAEHEGNFVIPKIIFSVALENLANQYKPYPDQKRLNKIIKNLRYF